MMSAFDRVDEEKLFPLAGRLVISGQRFKMIGKNPTWGDKKHLFSLTGLL